MRSKSKVQGWVILVLLGWMNATAYAVDRSATKSMLHHQSMSDAHLMNNDTKATRLHKEAADKWQKVAETSKFNPMKGSRRKAAIKASEKAQDASDQARSQMVRGQ